jgi:hypothetical protein
MKKRNKDFFNYMFGNSIAGRHYLVVTIISALFKSLLRVNEQGGGAGGEKTEFQDNLFKEIYFTDEHPYNIPWTINESMVTPYGYASSVLFKAILDNIKELEIPTVHKGIISFSSAYYLDPNDKDTLGIKAYAETVLGMSQTEIIKDLASTVKKRQDAFKILFHYAFTSSGHYLDHCRANWSETIYSTPSILALHLSQANQEDIIQLFRNMLQVLSKTKGLPTDRINKPYTTTSINTVIGYDDKTLKQQCLLETIPKTLSTLSTLPNLHKATDCCLGISANITNFNGAVLSKSFERAYLALDIDIKVKELLA